jgi:outer membrane protein
MKSSPFLTLGVGAVAALAFAAQADAQSAKSKAAAAKPAAAAAPEATKLTLTAPVPGVCVLSREGLVQGSTVGAYLNERMKQLGAVVQAEISTDQTNLQTDAKALDAQKATLQSDVYAQRAQGLQQRLAQLQQKAQQREREIQATEQKAVGRVLQAAGPLVAQTVVQRNCGILLDANAVLIANPTLDITPTVIQGLNGVLTQFPFDREHLDAQTPPAG